MINGKEWLNIIIMVGLMLVMKLWTLILKDVKVPLLKLRKVVLFGNIAIVIKN